MHSGRENKHSFCVSSPIQTQKINLLYCRYRNFTDSTLMRSRTTEHAPYRRSGFSPCPEDIQNHIIAAATCQENPAVVQSFCSGHVLEALHSAVGGGVGDIATDNLIFVHQQGSIDRFGSVREIVDFVNVAHDCFPGILT